MNNEDLYSILSVMKPDGTRDRELLKKQVYRKYSKEELQDQLIQFRDNNLDLSVLSDSGKSLSKLCIHFFREEQYKAKNARAKYSPDEILNSDELLQEAFEKIDSKPDYYNAGSDYKNFVSFITNEATMVSKVAIFSPNLARKIYEKYCPKFYANIHDSSCVDDETEYFNGYEWKSIKDYQEGDMVLQYNEDGTASLVEPLDYIHYKSDEPFYKYKNYNIEQCLTGNHKIVYRNRVNETSILEDKVRFVTVDEIQGRDFRGRIPLTFRRDGDVHIDESMLRLAIAVQADGHKVYKSKDKPYRWQARFSKERKIERFKQILESNNIEYTLSEDTYDSDNNTGYKNRWTFNFESKELSSMFEDEYNKTFPKEWYNLDKESKDVILDEIFNWDGYNECYINTNKNNAELIYYIINSSGYSASISCDIRKNKSNLKPCYYVKKRFYKHTGINKEWVVIDKEDKYCFTVPSHMLVLRRNGMTFITGNCGWGNRSQGALTSKYCYNYFGTDPNSALHEHYNEQADFIRETLHTDNKTDFRCCGSEVFIPEWEGKMDLSFTSPPYFNTEKYSSELTQSAAKCANYYAWRDDFMRPTIQNVFKYLKPNSYYLLNLKNLTPTFGSFPALNDWAIVAQQEGFILEGIDVMHYQSSRQFGTSKKTGKKREVNFTGDKEPVLVLRKPKENEHQKQITMLYPNTIDKSWENRNKKSTRK